MHMNENENNKEEAKEKQKYRFDIYNANISLEGKTRAIAFKEYDQIYLDATQEKPNLPCVEVWYNKTIKQIGWDKMYVKTYGNCTAEAEFYIAGLFEGKFSHRMIKSMYDGMKQMTTMEDAISKKVFKRLNQHYDYLYKKITNLNDLRGFERIYWAHIKLLMLQLEGMLDGYNSSRNPSEDKMTMLEMYFINADGEINELTNALQDSRYRFRFKQKNNGLFRFKEQKEVEKLSMRKLMANDPNLFMYYKETESHCTVVLKLMRDQNKMITDLYAGHSTWDDYREMVRIWKEYDFKIKDKQIKISFPSYGGTIYSTDDWYNLSNGMIVTQTTMEILNAEIYKKIKSAEQSLPNFFRIYVANLLSDSPYDWIDVFKRESSDTYSSQWMLVDYNKVKQSVGKQYLEYNTVIVYEQVVDKTGSYDVSDLISYHGYFAGYNRPYFLADYAGFTDAEQKYGNKDKLHLYSNYSNPRAILIRYLQKFIENMTDFKHLMRYNNANKMLLHKNEIKYSHQYQIAPRFDRLDVDIRKQFGATDAKIVNLEMAQEMKNYAISGPTTDGVEPYVNEVKGDVLPKTWNFNWVLMDEDNLKREYSDNM